METRQRSGPRSGTQFCANFLDPLSANIMQPIQELLFELEGQPIISKRPDSMGITVEFKHAQDHHYALFTNMERMHELIKDIDAVLACVRNNDNQILDTDLNQLHARISAIICEIAEAEDYKISQE